MLLIKLLEEQRSRSRQLRPGRKTHDANLLWVEIPVLRMCSNQADSLQPIIHHIRLHVVAIFPQPISQDHRVYSILIKERHEIGAFRADVKRVVAASSRENDGAPGVDS